MKNHFEDWEIVKVRENEIGSQWLFQHVDLQFLPGNCYGIIGANGAGKSTFLLGNQHLYDVVKGKDAIYEKEDFSDEDGLRTADLEAESDASRLLQGLGIGTEMHYDMMADTDPRLKVKVLLASHDHEMLTSTCNHVITFQPDGTIIDKYGAYDDHLAWMAEKKTKEG